MRKWNTLIALLLCLLAASAAYAQTDRANIRFVNLSLDLATVDVRLSRERTGVTTIPTLSLALGEVSGWRRVEAGTYTAVGESPVNETLSFASAPFEAAADDWITVVVMGTGDRLRALALRENYSPLNAGDARLTLLVALDDVESLDLLVDGAPFYRGLRPPAPDTATYAPVTLDLTANRYALAFAQPDGDTNIPASPDAFELIADTNTLLAIYHSPAQPQTVLKVEPVGEAGRAAVVITPEPTLSDGLALLRVAHLSSGTPPLEFTINGRPFNSYLLDRPRSMAALRFPEVSDWIALPVSGAFTITITVEGEPLAQPIIPTFSLELQPGTHTTLTAIGTLANDTLRAHAISEDYSTVGPDSVRLGVLNAHPGIGPVNVLLAGAPPATLITQLGYPGYFGANDGFSEAIIEAGVYDVEIVTVNNGQLLVTVPERDLRAGRNYLIVIIAANPPYYYTFSDLTESQNLLRGAGR